MKTFTACVTASVFAIAALAPVVASAEPTGAVAAIDANAGTAVERVLTRDPTLGERIAAAYHAPDRAAAQAGAVAAIDQAAFSSAELWRLMQPPTKPILTAAR